MHVKYGDQPVLRDQEITRQRNSFNQFLTKRDKCERNLQDTQNP